MNLENNISTEWKYLNFHPSYLYIKEQPFSSHQHSSSHSSSVSLYIPDSEDSGDVPAPVSSLSLHMRWLDLLELVPEPVGLSAAWCSLLDTEGVCKVLSEATDNSDSSCRTQSAACVSTFTPSSGPVEEKHQQSNQLIFL